MSAETSTLRQDFVGSNEGRPPTPSAFPVVPILAFVTLWLGGSWLVVGAWWQAAIPGGWWTVFGILAMVLVPVRALIRGFQGVTYPSAATRLFLFRPFWYAMLFAPILAITTLLGGLAGLPFGASGTVGRMVSGTVVALLILGALVGYFGSRRLVVRPLEASLPRLPPTFDGLRVVQLSDLHVGPHTSRSFLKRIVDAVEASRPDLIVFTGDQVDDFTQDVETFNETFGGLQAPHGVYVIAGNHDVYAGWDGVAQGLKQAGFTVLVNEASRVEQDGQPLWIVGTGDPAGRSPLGRDHVAAPNIERALAGIPPQDPILALAHNPELWPALVRRGVDLTLSGHTHYGQLAIPSLNWSAVTPFVNFAMGVYRAGRSLLYINPGTNFWGIPFRLGTPPEVTVLTLRSGDGDAAISVGGRSAPA